MKQIISALILLAAFSNPSLAQGTGTLDGNNWNEMPEPARFAFVVGWTESEQMLRARFKTHNGPCNLPEFRNPHATIGDLEDEITRLYRDPRNRPVWLEMMTPIAEESLAGQSEQKTKLALQKAREVAAQNR